MSSSTSWSNRTKADEPWVRLAHVHRVGGTIRHRPGDDDSGDVEVAHAALGDLVLYRLDQGELLAAGVDADPAESLHHLSLATACDDVVVLAVAGDERCRITSEGAGHEAAQVAIHHGLLVRLVAVRPQLTVSDEEDGLLRERVLDAQLTELRDLRRREAVVVAARDEALTRVVILQDVPIREAHSLERLGIEELRRGRILVEELDAMDVLGFVLVVRVVIAVGRVRVHERVGDDDCHALVAQHARDVALGLLKRVALLLLRVGPALLETEIATHLPDGCAVGDAEGQHVDEIAVDLAIRDIADVVELGADTDLEPWHHQHASEPTSLPAVLHVVVDARQLTALASEEVEELADEVDVLEE